MLTPMIIAIALGIVPVSHDGSVRDVGQDYSGKVGHYSQVVDPRGTTHIKGRNNRGRPYELILTRNGYVEASFGEQVISFRVQQKSSTNP